jgi:hypothetical protein
VGHGLKQIGEQLRRRDPLLRILPQQLPDDVVQDLRRLGRGQPHRAGCFESHAIHDGGQRRPGKRRLAGQQGVQHAPQTVQIAARRRRFAFDLLR